MLSDMCLKATRRMLSLRGCMTRIAERDSGRFPFPEFEDSEREQLKDVLDYPQKGAPHYEPRDASSALGSDLTSQRSRRREG